MLVKNREKIPDFIMLFQEAVTMMLNGTINKSALNVFVYFLGKMQYSNHIGIDQKTIAEETKLSLGTIKLVVPELQRLNIIIKYEDLQDKRRNVYIINPLLAWKGRVKDRKKVMKTIDKSQLDIFGKLPQETKEKKGIQPNTEF